MPHFYAMLKPVRAKNLSSQAYYVDEIMELFSPAHRKAFDAWLQGKTLLVIRDRGVIYRKDLDAFFDTL